MDVHISNLRKKLRDVDAWGAVRTVRGFEYALKGQSANSCRQGEDTRHSTGWVGQIHQCPQTIFWTTLKEKCPPWASS
ncbi:hypothetical protein [Deinococcus malanensis]|uniref:hypothetical protein n=1 Tax=Deinococcus malanensis TaxID=1706855 RepID=UPI0016645EBF